MLASNDMTFSLELYKTKLDNNTLNNTILEVLKTLEANGDNYTDTFPVLIDPTFSFDFPSEERKQAWIEKYKFKEDVTPEEAFYYFKDLYEIESNELYDIRRIIVVRYRIASEGYSVTKSITISNEICRQSALTIDEQADKYPGFDVITNSKRTYPNSNVASHILGYINSISEDQYKEHKDEGYTMNDIFGQAGIEYVCEKYLKGQNGIKQIDMSVDGSTVGEYIEEEAIAGSNVVLTIDANLQVVAEQSLRNAIQEANKKDGKEANSGSVVVMNVNTGEILAMASCPDFSPSDWVGGIDKSTYDFYNSEEGNGALINRCISSPRAPGSTFKMVTGVTALQTGNVKINEKVNDTGIYPRGHKPKCWIYASTHHGHGYLNITSAIKQSCNYFFFEMGYRVGIDNLSQYAYSFGLGKKTGIELPSESAGVVASREHAKSIGTTWNTGDTLNAAIGQGYNSFTSLQMAKYISILARGGKQINPTVIKTIINADGSEVSKDEIRNTANAATGYEGEEAQDIDISQENWSAIMEGMRGVANDSVGTAYSVFKNFNIEIGGKTGSAQEGDKTHAWFVGFAPYNNPEIAVACIIEKGGNSAVACYPARDLIAEYFGMNSATIEENLTAIPITEIST